MSEDDNVHNFNKASLCLFLTTNIFLQEKQVSEFFSFCKFGSNLIICSQQCMLKLERLKKHSLYSKHNDKSKGEVRLVVRRCLLKSNPLVPLFSLGGKYQSKRL